MFSHHERVNMAISKSGLPKTVLELFDPRQDLEYKPPIDKKPPVLPLLGLAGYVGHFPDPEDPDYQPPRSEVAQKEDRKFRNKEYHLQASIDEPTILERREAKSKEKELNQTAALEAAKAAYDPKSDPNAADTDAMRTLFVSRLDYATPESDLYTEFEKHGPIRSMKLIRDHAGKSRGYAFIEFQHAGDMKTAYKAYPPDGFVKIGGSERWSVVDVERGRTVTDWRPMRLGGGTGGQSRLAKPKQTKKAPGAPPGRTLPGPPAPGGGYGGDRDRRGPPMDSRYRDDRSRPRPDNGARDDHRERDRYGGGPREDRYGARAERDRVDRYGGPPRSSGGGYGDRGPPRGGSDWGMGGGGGSGGGYRDSDRGRGPPRGEDRGYGAPKRDRGDDRYGDRHRDYGDRDRRGPPGGGGSYGERDHKRSRYDDRGDRDRGYRR